jgi:glycosyltransferase involved in cell wall biosynthesis
MSQTKKPLASIIIVNFNNAKYLEKSLNSVLSQSYKNKEIIVIDDISKDKSLEILKKYKKIIKYYVNKTKTNYGSYNQINSYYKGILKSKGKYLFLLDSDDFFNKHKIELVVKKFQEDKSNKVLFDLPIIKFQNKIVKNKFLQKKFLLSSWPRFTPQSCISIEKKYALKVFKILKIKKYPTIWLDFRIAIISFLHFKEIVIIDKYLTYYRQVSNSASKKYRTMSKNWWIRRKEAHDFFSNISKKLKLKNTHTVDKVITKFINILIK